MKKLILSISIIIFVFASVSGQSGGTYQITQSVTGNGGGNASGGIYSLDGTAGQSVTEQTSQVPFQLNSGFWQSSFSPTAAGVSISGRVLASEGRGLRNAIVSLNDASGNTRTARTSTFGYYRFDELEAGQAFVVSVRSKRFQFEPRVLTVNEDLTDVDFVPIGNKQTLK